MTLTKTTLLSAFAAVGIASTLMALPAAPALAQYDDDGEDATRCVSMRDGSLYNACGFTIEVTWCVENVDCRNGRYTNQWTLGAYGSYPINGGRSGNYVRWGACKGRNSVTTNGTDSYSWEHICRKGG